MASPLIAPAELAAASATADVAIVDCRFDLARPEWGEDAYRAAHIPGAVYAHLDRDLSGPKTGRNGRHPLPDPDLLREAFGRLGIDAGVRVVAYDQDSGMFASRLWWLLRWLGHDAVQVLDGGLARWTSEGHPTSGGTEQRTPRVFTGEAQGTRIVTQADVAAMLDSGHGLLVDARAPERFRGDVEPLDPVAGHIPGAVNRFFQENLAGGRFKPADVLRVDLDAVLGGRPAEDVVCYCGSGVTACHNLLALEHAGRPGARLYAGSWSEWVANPANPVERG